MISRENYKEALSIVKQYEEENGIRKPYGTLISGRTPKSNPPVKRHHFHSIVARADQEYKWAVAFDNLGKNLRSKRDETGLTIEQLSEKSNITETTIKNIERGACYPIDIRIWFMLAKGLRRNLKI